MRDGVGAAFDAIGNKGVDSTHAPCPVNCGVPEVAAVSIPPQVASVGGATCRLRVGRRLGAGLGEGRRGAVGVCAGPWPPVRSGTPRHALMTQVSLDVIAYRYALLPSHPPTPSFPLARSALLAPWRDVAKHAARSAQYTDSQSQTSTTVSCTFHSIYTEAADRRSAAVLIRGVSLPRPAAPTRDPPLYIRQRPHPAAASSGHRERATPKQGVKATQEKQTEKQTHTTRRCRALHRRCRHPS